MSMSKNNIPNLNTQAVLSMRSSGYYSEKTIGAKIAIDATKILMDKSKMAAESLDAIKRVELDLHSGDELVENLSGGERQGVVIARALFFRTKVLIMDEPTNHLSVKETNKVLNWIEKLKSEGTTCIFITHNLHHVYPVSDRLVVFARGEKIADVKKKDTSIEDLTKMIVHD